MEAREAIMTRRTIHDWRDESLPGGALERGLEAARRAPNHKLTRPWRFTIAGPEARRAIVALGVAIKGGEGLSSERRAKIERKLSAPAALVIVSQRLTDDALREREDYAAVACAIQNLSLALWSEGIGSKWSSGAITRDERAYAIARIEAKYERIVGFVWVGYPARVPAEGPRPPDEAIVRRIP